MINTIEDKTYPDFKLKKGRIHTFINPYTYMVMREHVDILEEFDELHFDGIAMCKIYKWFGIKDVPRRSFDLGSLARDVLDEAGKSGKSVALIGSEKGVIDSAANKLKDSFSLNVVKTRNGFFDSEEEVTRFQRELLELDPEIVIVGMGAGRQEKFLVDLKNMGWSGTGFTCGGFLHQTAARLEYYPAIINKLNLRWLFRIFKEPHVLGRVCFDYPKFLFYFTEDYLKWKRSQSGSPVAS